MSNMRSEGALIYGLGGAKGSGKDTLALLYQQVHPDKDVRIIGMSDPLRDAIMVMNPAIYPYTQPEDDPSYPYMSATNRLYRDVYKETMVTYKDEDPYTAMKRIPAVRQWLQTFGTEVGREIIGENVWVDVMKASVTRAIKDGADVVFVTGIRFKNELDAIHEMQGTAVWVTRIDVYEIDSHSSENSLTLPDFDRVIHNYGTIEEFRTKIKASL